MRRVDVDVVRAGILLDQVLLPFAKLGSVLVDVLRVDAEQGLLVLVRVGPEAAVRLVVGGRLGQAAGISRDRAIGITGLDGAELGQCRAELLGFVSRHGRHGTAAGTDQGSADCIVQFHQGLLSVVARERP